jgi:hypothetical protein
MPVSLGSFKQQPTLHQRVCETCDREIGKCEEQIVKNAPEALLKSFLGIKGRHKNKSTSPFERRHSGHGPIKMKGVIPGIKNKILVKPIGDGKNVEISNQIIITDSNAKDHHIPLYDIDSLNTEKVKQIIKSTGVKQISGVSVTGENNEITNRIFSLLKKIFSGDEEAEIIKPFQGIIKTTGSLTYDDRYFRGIAKIAFHYYLAFNTMGHWGNEVIFKPIRDFVRHGKGKVEDFISKHKGYFVENLKQGWSPPTYGHFLYSELTNKSIITKVQLFLGPEYDPPYYEIILATKPLSIEISRQVFGHNYAYLPDNQKNQYSGTLHKLAIANKIRLL